MGIAFATATPSIAATHDPSKPWSSLGVIHPLLVQSAGLETAISAQPTSQSFGWCSNNGVEISSGGRSDTLVPDRSVGQMLERSHMGLPTMTKSSPTLVTCDVVALDPHHPRTVYVGFEASQNGTSIPPIYNVALVTSNAGKSWKFVPPPPGDSPTDFSGFIERPSGVELLYSRNIFFPLKSGQSTTLLSVTSSNGGTTWSDGHLSCSADAP
jgi:hypothetical protein